MECPDKAVVEHHTMLRTAILRVPSYQVLRRFTKSPARNSSLNISISADFSVYSQSAFDAVRLPFFYTSCQGASPLLYRLMLISECLWPPHEQIPRPNLCSHFAMMARLELCIFIFSVLLASPSGMDSESWCTFSSHLEQECPWGKFKLAPEVCELVGRVTGFIRCQHQLVGLQIYLF